MTVKDLSVRVAMLEKRLADVEAAQSTPTLRTVKVGDLEWQVDVPNKSLTWEEANDYAASLGNGWRLPTLEELQALVGYDKYLLTRRVIPDYPDEWLWTSSAVSGDSTRAFIVNADGVCAYGHVVCGTYPVRCVR